MYSDILFFRWYIEHCISSWLPLLVQNDNTGSFSAVLSFSLLRLLRANNQNQMLLLWKWPCVYFTLGWNDRGSAENHPWDKGHSCRQVWCHCTRWGENGSAITSQVWVFISCFYKAAGEAAVCSLLILLKRPCGDWHMLCSALFCQWCFSCVRSWRCCSPRVCQQVSESRMILGSELEH